MKNRLYLLIVFFVSFIACKRETILPSLDPGVNYKCNILGFVNDSDSLPVEGALVSYAGVTKLTDKNGIYIFNNVEVNSKNSYLKINKSGYFQAGRSFNINKPTNLQLRHTLTINLFDSYSYQSNQEIIFDNVNISTIPSDALVFESNGTPFNGNFKYSGKYLDPTIREFSDLLTGNFNGISLSNTVLKLTSFGVLNFELQTEQAEKLKFKNDKQLDVSLLIPPSLLSIAPANISTWYFNDSLGYWKEYGSAHRVGNIYKGKISHTGRINFASAKPSVNIFGKITDQNGIPIPSDFKITKFYEEIGSFIHTNEDGSFSTPVNQNEYFTMKTYYHPSGGNSLGKIYTYGPYLKDTTLQDFIADFYSAGTYILKGEFLNCINEPINNGYLKIIQGTDVHYFQIINGNCEATFRTWDYMVNSEVTIINQDDNKISIPIKLSGTGPHNLGVLKICL